MMTAVSKAEVIIKRLSFRIHTLTFSHSHFAFRILILHAVTLIININILSRT